MSTKKTKSPTEVKVEKVETVDPIEAMYDQPLTKLKALVRYSPNTRRDLLTDALYREVVELGRMSRIPLYGIILIPTTLGIRPYVNAEGVAWAVSHDDRGVSEETSEVLHYPNPDEPYAVVQASIELGDGSHYSALGAVNVSRDWPEGNAILKAETKAKRRVGYRVVLTRMALPVYDEDVPEPSNGAATVVEIPTLKEGPPTTVGALISWATAHGFAFEDLSSELPLTEQNVPQIHAALVQRVSREG